MKKLNLKNTAVLLVAGLIMSACASIPKGATPISDFEAEKYLGKWYEIARLDHRFERNLQNVTAEYRLNDDGTILVVNRGFDTEKNEWESAEGKAKFRGEQNVAALKVSFFGPFYSGYNVIDIDEDYQYALVAGESLKYLWILSRTKTIPDDIRQDFLQKATNIGYDTSQLIWVEQDDEQ